jgi:hypothetical protein
MKIRPVVPCGQIKDQADMTELIVAFRNFPNAPKTVTCEDNIRGNQRL